MSHWGILIRARLSDCPPMRQDIMRTDSDRMYMQAMCIGGTEWIDLLGCPIIGADGKEILSIQYRPLWLPDSYGEEPDIIHAWRDR